MNENLCIAIITAASIFAGFLVAFLSSYLTARNKKYDENKLKFDTLGRKLHSLDSYVDLSGIVTV